MKAWAMKMGPTRLGTPKERKIRKKKKTHQIWAIGGQESLHGVLDCNNGGKGDQPSYPLSNLASLEHLPSLPSRILTPA
jgi:hypothetical protein